jgi:hypothetical protein
MPGNKWGKVKRTRRTGGQYLRYSKTTKFDLTKRLSALLIAKAITADNHTVLYRMLNSPDPENLTVAEVLIEQYESKKEAL